MQERVTSGWLVADFFTHSYRISGRVSVRQSKLAAQLNDRTSEFIPIEEAYVSNVEHPADITASHGSLILRKDNIAAVVVARQDDGLLREQAYGSYLGTQTRRVFVTVPSFEIAGLLRFSGRIDMRTVLTTGTDYFLAVLDAEMKSSARPDVTFTGGAILVNKHRIETFSVKQE